MIFLAGFLNSEKGEVSGQIEWMGVDPVVALHLRNAADYRIPTFRPRGTKIGNSWYQWIRKMIFLAGFLNSEKGEVSGQIEWTWGWSQGCTPPQECCRLQPTYYWTPWHKLGHSWYQWLTKYDFSGCFDNSEKDELSGQIEWMRGWSRGCTPPKECCRLPPTYFWTTWHHTRAFLISVNNKSDICGLFDTFEKDELSGQIEWMGGWSRGCTPPKECCRRPHTYF